MDIEEHQGSQLKYLIVHPDNYDPNVKYPLIIMLHGFGANMQDLAGIAPILNATGYVYSFPNAPEEMDLAPGMVGYSWTHPDRRRDPKEDAEKPRPLFGHGMWPTKGVCRRWPEKGWRSIFKAWSGLQSSGEASAR